MTTEGKPVAVETSNGQIMFHCPGCKFAHAIDPKEWSFNGDLVRPTIKPSILATYNYGKEQRACRCHSFVTDGQIRFLTDCTHELAGKTVPLEPVEDW